MIEQRMIVSIVDRLPFLSRRLSNVSIIRHLCHRNDGGFIGGVRTDQSINRPSISCQVYGLTVYASVLEKRVDGRWSAVSQALDSCECCADGGWTYQEIFIAYWRIPVLMRVRTIVCAVMIDVSYRLAIVSGICRLLNAHTNFFSGSRGGSSSPIKQSSAGIMGSWSAAATSVYDAIRTRSHQRNVLRNIIRGR